MECIIEIVSYGMICMPNFINIGTGLQVILRSGSEILKDLFLVFLNEGIYLLRRCDEYKLTYTRTEK
jgi:hypothetical protein